MDVAAGALAAEFRDDALVEGGDTYEQVSALYWRSEIEASGVPMLVLASWLDAGTADGALRRLERFSNPQKLVLLASNHGGGWHASPFAVERRPLPPIPSVDEQVGLRIDFLDHHLRGVENGVEEWPTLRYFNLGEEVFLETNTWPVPGTERHRFHFHSGGGLSTAVPQETAASDEYAVDFGVTTGPATRWSTQLGGVVVGLSDRGEMDERMLTYTSEPLSEDLQVTGTPVVTLRVTPSHADAAVLVYLEDVDPSGRSRYVTEGGLRALHRRTASGAPVAGGGREVFPQHTFRRKDAEPLVSGQEVELGFQLWPTSVLFEKGHRIRIAIAGADAGNLEPLPDAEGARFEISCSSMSPSFVELPVVSRR